MVCRSPLVQGSADRRKGESLRWYVPEEPLSKLVQPNAKEVLAMTSTFQAPAYLRPIPGFRQRMCVLAVGVVTIFFSATSSSPTQAAEPCHVYNEVNVYITADNAYNFGFGYGSGLAPGSLQNGGAFIENCTNADIFSCGFPGPETYLHVPVSDACNQYLYIIAYSDNSVSQGLLARFVNPGGLESWTGDNPYAWEVYATGIETNPNCSGGPPNSPSVDTINAQIANANATNGWVSAAGGTDTFLQIGEANDATANPSCGSANEFPQACVSIMGTQPRWIWYNPGVADAFCGNVAGEFLIFRTPARHVALVPETVPALSSYGMAALVVGLLAVGAWLFRRR